MAGSRPLLRTLSPNGKGGIGCHGQYRVPWAASGAMGGLSALAGGVGLCSKGGWPKVPDTAQGIGWSPWNPVTHGGNGISGAMGGLSALAKVDNVTK